MSEQTQNILPPDEEVVEVVQASKKKQRSLFFRLLRMLFRVFFTFALLLLILRLLITVPYIQNKLIHWTTDNLSERLDTRVEIDRIQLDFFDQLDLHGVYIEDFHGDTLLYTQQLHVDIKFYSLINKKIIVEDIVFDNTRFNLHRYPREYFTDLQHLIAKLSKPYEPGPPTDNPTFYFDCNEVFFDDLRFGFQNAYNGDKMLIYVKDLMIKIAKTDFYQRTLVVESVVLNEPKAEFVKAIDYDIPESAYPQKHPADTIVYPIDTTQAQFWTITVNDFALKDGSFNFDNVRFKNFFDLDLDLQHFDLELINLKVKDILVRNWIGTWKVISGTLKEKRGFEVTSFKSNMMVRVDSMAFYDMALTTPESYVGDTVIFAYKHISSMGDFNNKVKMDVRSKNSVIAIQDLLVFAPQLKRNAFFRQNKDGKLLLKGRIYDRVNRLKGDDIYLSIGQNATLKGSFKSRNFTKPDETLLQLNLNELTTNMRNIKLMFPELQLNDQFYKLGNLSFKGKFDGFYHDFVADGNLKSDLGRAEVSLNFKSPTNARLYSGTLNLYDFDLKTWTDNENFGNVTFKSKVSGTGGTLASLNIKIDSDIESFIYKKYPYENIIIDGNFNKKSFIGEMGIVDGNIDLNFNGEVNFNGDLPKFDLTSDISHLDLKALNLSKDLYKFDAHLNLNFIGDDLDNIVGRASIQDLRVETSSDVFELDSLVLRSTIEDDFRKMTLNSEILTASLGGRYTIKNIEKPILNFVAQNYPSFAKKLNIRYDENYATNEFAGTENFIFDAQIFDSKNLTYLLDKRLDTIQDLNFKANFNRLENSFKFKLLLPSFGFDNVKINGITATSDGVKNEGKLIVTVNETKIGNLNIPTIALENYFNKDTIAFNTSISSITNIFSSVNINGQFFLTDNQFQVRLDSSDLQIAEDKWKISDNNYIKFGSDYIYTNNFVLTNKEQSIALNSIGNKGLQLDVSNLPLEWLDQFFTIPFIDFGGKLNTTVFVNDFSNITEDSIRSIVQVDSFYINNDYFGALNINAFIPKLRKPLRFKVDLSRMVLNDEEVLEPQSLRLEGKYILPFGGAGKSFFNRPNTFNFNAKAQNFPFSVAEYFVQGISGTKGKVAADLIFTGDVKHPKAKGNLRLTEASTRIDYLQTFYRLDDVNVVAKDDFFDFTGSELIDKFGNIAYIDGGINHTYLKDFQLNLRINSKEFLLIDTEKKDNDLFYGRGIGSANVEFTGSLKEPNIAINATTSRDSWMAIPLMTSSNAKAVTFIDFVNPKDTAKVDDKNVNFLGANLKLELNVTPQAEISLIFDESVGDIMRGRGRGNLSINVTNKGEFTMFGAYELESGEYLFTYNQPGFISINKPFTVKKGGTITWDGSPYTAQVNIDAIYKGLRTSPYNLILEYITSDEQKAAAQRATDVDLLMALRGDLMKPDIGFDILFPNVNQQIKPNIDSKMQIVRADKNELNRQVFGLIVLKSFLPNEGNIALDAVGKTYANTLTEMLSNQLSLYVTGLVSEIITDVDFVSGVDFDFNYQPYTDFGADPTEYTGLTNDFQVSTQSRLFDNRVIVAAGGGVENSVQDGRYFTGDFVVEYVISEDGRLRLKAYRRSDPDISGNRNKTGIGASYSIEFDSFRKQKKESTPIPLNENPINNEAPNEN